MYWEAGMLDQLEGYVRANSGDKELQTWWGRYCVSQGHTQDAIACYEKAGGLLL